MKVLTKLLELNEMTAYSNYLTNISTEISRRNNFQISGPE